MSNEAALGKTELGNAESAGALEIKGRVRQYVQENHFLGAPPNRLEDGTSLVTSGIIDSIGMIGLVAFIEEQFHIELQPGEINAPGLDSLDRIEVLVRRKLEQRA